MTTMEFNTQLVNLKPSLERFALSLTTDKEDANDLVQETYMKALANREKFIDYSNLKAWTFTIMKNTFINNYRKAVNHNTKVDSTKEGYFINQSKEAKSDNPDGQLSFKEINKAIATLGDEFKRPFVMHVSGYKYKEIADEMELKIGTVKSRIFFARKKLMDQLNDFRDN